MGPSQGIQKALPAGDASSFGAVSAKSTLYHSGQANGDWCSRFALFADDEWSQYSETEHIHTDHMEIICYEDLPNFVKYVKFYLIDYPWPPGTVPGGVHPAPGLPGHSDGQHHCA